MLGSRKFGGGSTADADYFDELARRDVNEAVEHHLTRAPAAVALSFIDALEEAFRRLGEHPASGSPRYQRELALPGLRSWVVRRSPYLAFCVEREADVDVSRRRVDVRPEIVAVVHIEAGDHHLHRQCAGSQAREHAARDQDRGDELHPPGNVDLSTQWVIGREVPQQERLLCPVQGQQEGEQQPEAEIELLHVAEGKFPNSGLVLDGCISLSIFMANLLIAWRPPARGRWSGRSTHGVAGAWRPSKPPARAVGPVRRLRRAGGAPSACPSRRRLCHRL